MSEMTDTLIRENRFEPTPGVLWTDRIMNHLIKVGGIGVILSVAGIFIFILSQILPLFAGAKVEHLRDLPLNPQEQYQILAVDEWAELPLLVNQSGIASFVDAGTGKIMPANRLPLFDEATITSVHYHQDHQQLVYGTADGTLSIVDILYEPVFENDKRVISGRLEEEARFNLGSDPMPVTDAVYGGTDTDPVAVVVQERAGVHRISAVKFSRHTTLFGSGDLEVDEVVDLTDQIKGKPTSIGVSSNADNFYVVTDNKRVHCFSISNGMIDKIQSFFPFAGKNSEKIKTIDYLLGGVSLVITNSEGLNEVYSLFRPAGERKRLFGKIKTFKDFPGNPQAYTFSMRNKSFLIAGDGYASLRHSTTKSIRWEKKLPFSSKLAVISGKHQKMLFLDSQNHLQFFELNDPHPEAGIRAFFSKIWYEGASFPKYEWQSTGGTDQFEPKLSLVPLIIGSLKGTFYSLLLALPISILAAIYTSQFAHPKFKNIVKPVMEIMASLPSVVLGFMAALWLAPLIEYRVVSVLLMCVTLPAAMLIAGTVWTCLPRFYTAWLKSGYELIIAFPVILIALVLTWKIGPWFEAMFFTVTDASGQTVADFRLWWAAVSHANFEQRNSLIVGFMMGFAVIPIIFTITEDALSNVAPSLRSGSLALGASRWQTAMRVIIPTASAGILSAIMIGFGRAVGETMIVVMATGNTPIMDFNIFSGMRTLSANIAVELPEAPFHGTLYRTLFLGAMALFLMTFVLNTLAEVLREKLRKKYKTI